MAGTKYSISWDAYQNSICNGLSTLQQRGEYVDMTLAADGHHVKAHQMVLSLVSPYIKDLIASAACPHPVIFLNKVSYQTLQSILQYAYTGEVVVSNDMIQEFLNACKELHVKGLEESMSSFSGSENENQPQSETANSNAEPKFDFAEPHEESYFSDYDYDMNNPFENIQEPVSTVKSIEPVFKNTISDTADTTLKYTISNMGMAQLVLNRYIYFLRHPRKNGETMWRCINYKRKQCRAYIDVKDHKVVKRLQYTMSTHATVQLVLNRFIYCFKYSKKNGNTTTWRCINFVTRKCGSKIVVENSRVVKRPLIPPPVTISDTTLKYSTSKKGAKQIVLNRYLYCMRNERRDGKILWKCINYENVRDPERRCRARVVVDKNHKVVHRSCAHNHPYHDAQILKKLRNRNLFATMSEVQRAIEKKKKQLPRTETNSPIE